MKAIFVYSRLSGTAFIVNRINYIKEMLSKKFDELLVVESNSAEDLKKNCLLACKEYDYLIFAGGDGTVNQVINNIADEEHKPILGYIPAGTTNDFAKNFKIRKNVKSAIKNIINGVPSPFDVLKVNDRYVAYVLACGAFSEISYTVKQTLKKKISFLAYYISAMRDVFIPRKVVGTLTCNNQTYEVKTPFLLVLNGNHVGGFNVNFKNKINDGKFTVFITRPGIFNGLLHYLFFKVRTIKITTDQFSFKFNQEPIRWCIDGEMADLKNVEVKCCPSLLKILTTKHLAKKIYQEAQIATLKQ